jgi:hypothetical protein
MSIAEVERDSARGGEGQKECARAARAEKKALWVPMHTSPVLFHRGSSSATRMKICRLRRLPAWSRRASHRPQAAISWTVRCKAHGAACARSTSCGIMASAIERLQSA